MVYYCRVEKFDPFGDGRQKKRGPRSTAGARRFHYLITRTRMTPSIWDSFSSAAAEAALSVSIIV